VQAGFLPFQFVFLIFLSCSIALAKILSSILNKSEHLYLVPDFGGTANEVFTCHFDVDYGFVIYSLQYVEIGSF
jgi:hypothetical protein